MRIEDLYNEVVVRVPEVPTQLIESSARNALGRFFRNSTAWRVRVTGTKLKAGQSSVDLRALVDQPVCAITDLRVQGSIDPLHPRTVAQLEAVESDWRVKTGTRPTKYVAEEDPAIARVYPIPTEDCKVDAQVAVFPNAKTQEIPDWIGEMYFDELVDGILGVIYRIPKKSWTDLALAADGDIRLDDAARAARGRVEKSNTLATTFAVTSSFDEL